MDNYATTHDMREFLKRLDGQGLAEILKSQQITAGMAERVEDSYDWAMRLCGESDTGKSIIINVIINNQRDLNSQRN
jgi:phage/plasmid-associated DNA primase